MSSGQYEVLGYVECPWIANWEGTTTLWKVERGYCLVLVLVRFLSEKFEIIFDSTQIFLHLDNGKDIQPIGLAICLNEDFRGAPGQSLPMFLSTTSLHVAQNAGICFGLVFALEEIRQPLSINYDGNWTGSLEKLQESGAEGKGIQEEGGISNPTDCSLNLSLRGHVPFCDPAEALAGFATFKPSGDQSGIRAIGSHKEIGIVSLRLPPEEARKIGDIHVQDIRLELQDGTLLDATGLVISAKGLAKVKNTPEYFCGIMDKGSVGPGSTLLGGLGNIECLPELKAPICGYSALDCKIVSTFDRKLDWRTVVAAIVGGYIAEQVPETTVYI